MWGAYSSSTNPHAVKRKRDVILETLDLLLTLSLLSQPGAPRTLLLKEQRGSIKGVRNRSKSALTERDELKEYCKEKCSGNSMASYPDTLGYKQTHAQEAGMRWNNNSRGAVLWVSSTRHAGELVRNKNSRALPQTVRKLAVRSSNLSLNKSLQIVCCATKFANCCSKC